MKKYYLNNGKENLGPYDLSELKGENIKRDTPVWYEGIAGWTTADKIEELTGLLLTPPPIHNEGDTIFPRNIQAKKSKKGAIIGMVICVVLILLISFFVLKDSVLPPSPLIISRRIERVDGMDMKAKVTAVLQNRGGHGKVLIIFHVYQNGNSYERTESVYLNANDTRELEETFDEVKRLGGEITYSVDVSAQ